MRLTGSSLDDDDFDSEDRVLLHNVLKAQQKATSLLTSTLKTLGLNSSGKFGFDKIDFPSMGSELDTKSAQTTGLLPTFFSLITNLAKSLSSATTTSRLIDHFVLDGQGQHLDDQDSAALSNLKQALESLVEGKLAKSVSTDQLQKMMEDLVEPSLKKMVAPRLEELHNEFRQALKGNEYRIDSDWQKFVGTLMFLQGFTFFFFRVLSLTLDHPLHPFFPTADKFRVLEVFRELEPSHEGSGPPPFSSHVC